MDAGIISNASIQKQWRNLVEFGKNYKKWAKNDEDENEDEDE